MTEEMVVVERGKGHVFKKNGKHFKVKKQTYKKDGVTLSKEIYEEIDLREYNKMVKQLAQDICKYPSVKIEDILADALHDYDLETLRKIRKDLDKEIQRATEKDEEPAVKTRPGHCTELQIGDGSKAKTFTIRD